MNPPTRSRSTSGLDRFQFGLLLCLLIGLALAPAPATAQTSATLLTPVSITATGGGQDLNVAPYVGKLRVHLTSLNTAGTSPTLACKLQGSVPAAFGASYTTVGTNDIVLRNNTNDNIKLSASFTQSGAAQVKRVGLKLKKNGTITSGKILTLTLETNSAGDPSGTILGTAATVQTDDIATSYDWVVFTFANPVDVADATVYHFVLAGDYTVSSSNNITWRTATVASGGNANVFDSAYAAVSTNSREFYAYQYAFADVSGAAFTSLSTAGTASVQTLELNADDLPAVIRLYSTIGGTSNPAWTTAALVNGRLGNN